MRQEGMTIMSTTQAGPSGDPRIGWSATELPHTPALLHRRDGILPTVAAALSVRGETLTGTAARGDHAPPLHPLVQEFLDSLATAQRDRFTGRCDPVASRPARQSMSSQSSSKSLDAASYTAHAAGLASRQ